jgi:putative ABC transport system permease protein
MSWCASNLNTQISLLNTKKMFKLNLKIALRNLWKNKTSSFINVIGLAIGLAACLMLLVYVSYEWNYDKHGKNSANLYTIMTNVPGDDGKIASTFEASTTALGPLLKEEVPEIKHLARMNYLKKALIANGENGFKKVGKFAEPEILNLFDFQFIAGNKTTAMQNPKSVILTESTANILFGSTQVLNRVVRYQDKEDLTVAAVIKDIPDNSSATLKFDFLMPWAFYEMVDSDAKDLNWGNFSFVTMFLLDPQVNPAVVNAKIDKVVKAHLEQASQPYMLYPFTKLHLYGKFENGVSVGGDIEQIYLFVGLAFGILMIACINFMNMATAKSEKRAKEVGIKKTIGADRSSLVIQFLTESMVLTMLAVVFAIALLEIFLPTFNQVLEIKMDIAYFNFSSWMAILGIVLATGLIAGSYPAFYLSSFNPIQTLKRKIQSKHLLSISLRQVLVVGQFCFAIILIISTLVIYRQIQYVKNRPIGVDINTLVEVAQDGKLKEKFDLYKDQLLRSGAVTAVNNASTKLAHRNSNFLDIRWPGMVQERNLTMFNKVNTGYDFTKTNGIKLLEGRDFSEKFASDTAAVLISASAAKVMNLKHPVGENLTIMNDKYTVVGLFDDYVWDSPYKSNNPMIIMFGKDYTSFVTMRLNTANSLHANIEKITKITKDINPAYPIEISFLDGVYADLLKKEKTLGILSNLFGGLAIFVSSLGLFGLVAYSAEQRTKEFGVRKVLGASVANLMQLLSLSFIKMIVVAVIIAAPISYYAMNQWLTKFEFHTEISWWIIPIAALGTLTTALCTVSFQAYKSAKANPVDALKYE